MQSFNPDSVILRFLRDDIGGILITDDNGEVLYEDERTAFIRTGKTNWHAACPAARPGQRGETWDLLHSDTGKTYMVVTSTYIESGCMMQVHLLTDTSLYVGLYREISDLSRMLQTAKDHDEMTGLFNKGKFMEMKRTVFRKQRRIAVFYMDVNNLKQMNDTYGHEAGDQLIRTAAVSLQKIEARNIIPFRVGGDEFVVIALHVNREEAEQIRLVWEEGLADLNRQENRIPCEIAWGFAFGEDGFDLEEVLACADQRMYENKRKMKGIREDG